MNLTEKLKAFVGSSKGKIEKDEKGKKYYWLLEKIKGEVVKTQYGEHIEKTVVYGKQYEHSGLKLSKILEIPFDELDAIFNNKHKGMDILRTAFLDTETTGLAGGSGTYAFLIGVGFFEKNCFKILQFFMPDYSEEASILVRLNNVLSEFEFLITFNGKVYDIPLLNTRYVINKLDSPLKEIHNLDLLTACRKIFKKRLKSVALSNLEKQLLYMERENDIPGFLIPSVYFNYLRTGEIDGLLPIFYHNQKDILSMVNLLYAVFDVVKNPLYSHICRDEDYICIGKLYEDRGDFEKSIECYKKALETESVKKEAYVRLSLLYKKLNMWDKAVDLWMEMVNKNIDPVFALEELAKYFEHKEKNYEEAVKAAEKALSILMIKKRLLHIDDNKIFDFKKRLERLKGKKSKAIGQIYLL
ncbi:MAG: ribonuclease H-like domain-containing protein [Thermovenabulum sp.]|uniref:ribonuclease H-like domain-containing protein n=1 Tax=Thermovenabulum sp. TaxID=3100335 RepID=UPI003C7B1B20